MSKSKIEWTDYSWNFITGCTKVSAGCKNCYAETMAKRFWKDRKFSDIQIDESKIYDPWRMKKPKKIFVNSTSDLFHEYVPLNIIADAFNVMCGFGLTCRKKDEYHEHDADCYMGASIDNHIYQILTKRPKRMLKALQYDLPRYIGDMPGDSPISLAYSYDWIPENIWLGVSVEDKKNKDRIDILRKTPAAIRWISFEPLLEDLGEIDLTGIHWVVVGGESGPNARPMHPDWVRSIRDQCKDAGVPFFFKQWGEWIAEYPQNLSLSNRAMTYEYNTTFYKVGKAQAGNLLDGKQHLEYPI